MENNEHNIHGWHWSEKDFSSWANKELRRLLNFTADLDDASVEYTVTDVKGEAFKNIRKGKIRCSYDWNIKLNFTLTSANRSYISGQIDFEPISDCGSEDWDYTVKYSARDIIPKADLEWASKKLLSSVLIEKFNEWVAAFDEHME